MLAPTRKVRLGGQSVTLRADLYACIEYADLTDGESLEQAALKLQPDQDNEAGVITAKVNDPRVFMDLFYAFSAAWRDESGWNAEHATRPYDPTINPRLRQRYVDLAKMASSHEFTNVRDILFALLLDAVIPPGETATEKPGAGERSEP